MEIISPTVGTLQRLICVCRRGHEFGIEMVNQNLVIKRPFWFPDYEGTVTLLHTDQPFDLAYYPQTNAIRPRLFAPDGGSVQSGFVSGTKRRLDWLV